LGFESLTDEIRSFRAKAFRKYAEKQNSACLSPVLTTKNQSYVGKNERQARNDSGLTPLERRAGLEIGKTQS
jgi:hypothetical protein